MCQSDNKKDDHREDSLSALHMQSVSVRYPNGFEALHHVDLSVQRGHIVAIVGASGCGKSTLLRAVAGLERVSTGTITIDGVNVLHVPTHKRDVGMVFQDGQLFPHMNVYRNIAYGLKAHGWKKEAIKKRVAELLDLIELREYAYRPIGTLSGGQAQRIALARSLAPNPKILLLDEPLSALDTHLRASLSAQLREILTLARTTALYVTHDPAEAERVSDRCVRMREGKIIPEL